MWPFRSRMDVEERILVWVCGREVSWGSDIADGLGIGSGTLYPALQRMERLGRLESEWEGHAPLVPGKPRRRLYRVSCSGHAVLDHSLNVAAAESRRQAGAPAGREVGDG